LIVCSLAALCDAFAVTLHVALLEVGGEAVEILVIGKQSSGLGSVEVGIPNTEQGQNDWSLKVDHKVIDKYLTKDCVILTFCSSGAVWKCWSTKKAPS
jgi:hypothetical protein